MRDLTPLVANIYVGDHPAALPIRHLRPSSIVKIIFQEFDGISAAKPPLLIANDVKRFNLEPVKFQQFETSQ